MRIKNRLYETNLTKVAVTFVLCFVLCFVFLPLVENEGVIAEAESTIEIGDYVLMGTYYGEPILWRCVDIDENGPLMLSDKILCLKAFDANGDVTTGSHGRVLIYNSTQEYYRQKHGSNFWSHSKILWDLGFLI